MNEQIQKILNLFKVKPYSLRMGAKRIASWQGVETENVKRARIMYYNNLKQPITQGPKILIVDIETAPLRAYVWSRWR